MLQEALAKSGHLCWHCACAFWREGKAACLEACAPGARAVRSGDCWSLEVSKECYALVSHLLEKEILKKSNQSPFTLVLSEFCRTHGYPGDSGVKEKCF